MVWIRWPDPKAGDIKQKMAPAEAADFIIKENKNKDTPNYRFGVWEGTDNQLELEMATRTGILDALKGREEQTLRLVPIIKGG